MPKIHLRDGETGVAHLSDLHFGVGGDEAVWKLLEQILEETQPKLLLITGDLVDTPSETLFQEARQKLDGLKIPYRVCLGNHDRYLRGVRLRRWQEVLVSPKTPFVIITALFAAALVMMLLWPIWYWAAGAAILTLLFCLARIGVRRWLKIRTDPASFHTYFHDVNLHHSEPETLPVGDWKIGLLGVDSCTDADVYARGFVPTSVFSPLKKATAGKPVDLCICLVHHHLLSVRKLEYDRQNSSADLRNTTCMVNAGTLLEALAKAHVDIVLHGHEHRENWASYGSLDGGSGDLRVVGAGSATGTHNIKGWSQNSMSFNLLILGSDRALKLRRYSYQTDQWMQDPDVGLFDAATLRHSACRRSHAADLHGDITQGISKFIEFNRERDGLVYWYYTDWPVPNGYFQQRVRNSTGNPVEAFVTFFASSVSPEKIPAEVDPVADESHAWLIRCPVPDGVDPSRPISINLEYRWLGGALLTMEELVAAQERDQAGNSHRDLGPLRRQGYEFGVVKAPKPLAFLELSVTLPQEYAPEDDVPPEIFINGVQTAPGEIQELKRRVNELGPGQYMLRVDYPWPDVDYQIAWHPVSEATVAKRMKNESSREAFARIAGASGLLSAFAQPFRRRTPDCQWSLALYVYDPAAVAFVCSECMDQSGGQLPPLLTPRPVVECGTSQNALNLAWMGKPSYVERPRDDAAAIRLGYMTGEHALACVPIRYSLYAVNPPPWGVVRLAALNTGAKDLFQPNNKDRLDQLMLAGMTSLLAAALEKV